MALTLALLKAQEGLKGLSDEQLTSIATLSSRDEEQVIAKSYGEHYRLMDESILKHSGVSRNGDEKSNDDMVRALKALKEKSDKSSEYEGKVTSLTAEIDKLKKDISEGHGNEQLKKDLENANKELVSMRAMHKQVKEDFDAFKVKAENDRINSLLSNELSSSSSSFTLKKSLPEAMKRMALEMAKSKVEQIKHVWDDNIKSFVFQNADGTPMLDTSLAHVSSKSLLEKELKALGALEEGRNQPGTGSHGAEGDRSSGALDLSMVKGKNEAMNNIEKHLMENGVARTDPKFQEEVDKIWSDNKDILDKLPIE